MPTPTRTLVSSTTRRVFRDALAAWPIRELITELRTAGIPPQHDDDTPEIATGARRAMVDRFYATIDFAEPRAVQRALVVFGQVLTRKVRLLAHYTHEPEAVLHRDALDRLLQCLLADGYAYANGMVKPEAPELRLAFLMRDDATCMSEHGLGRLLEKLEALTLDDPVLAASGARDVCETCCRFILVERRAEEVLPRGFSELLGRTLEQLELLPEQTPPGRGRRVPAVRRVLETVSELCEGLEALSVAYSRPGQPVPLSARHARLGVDAAGTLARFLLATHRDRPGAAA